MKKNQIKKLDDEDFTDISKRMYVLMAKHIGGNNAISKRNIFKHFFGNPEKFNKYQQLFLWQKLSLVICYIRRRTKCFIVSEQRTTDYYFFVIKGQADANIYIKRANDHIKGLQGMKKRATQAVAGNWHKQVTANAKKKVLQLEYK